jgi:TolA-binding protein
VAAVATLAGAAAATKSALAAGAAPAASSWLAVKWFAIGLGTALGTLAVVDQVQQRQRPPLSPVAPAITPSAPLQPALPSPATPSVTSAEPSPVLPPRSSPTPPLVGETVVEPRAAAPRDAAGHFDAPSLEQLSREVAALKRARSALSSGSAAQARLALRHYRSEFPKGVLAIEAAALEVETAFALGERDRALVLAAAFLRDHGSSPLAARIRALARADAKP